MENNTPNAAPTDADIVANVAQNLGESSSSTGSEAESNPVSGVIKDAKDTLKTVIPGSQPPTETPLAVEASLIKKRLEQGEPALTIIDIRDRPAFNAGRITGAISMPAAELVERAQAALEFNRDIYLYGDSDIAASEAANSLRAVGFLNAAEIKGGLNAWQQTGAPVEGTAV